MTSFTYSTELSIQGPWLLGKSALEELDQILERAWLDHQQQRQSAIDEKVAKMVAERKNHGGEPTADELAYFRERAESYDYRSKRSAIAHFSSTKSLQAETVRDAVNQLVATDEYPKGLSVSLSVGKLEASISVGQATYSSDLMRIRVSPETSSASRDLFGALRQWAETHQPPLWQRISARLGGILWIPWMIALSVITSALPDQESVAKEVARQTADTLLRGGITASETPAAVELLLRIATGRIVTPPVTAMPRWFWIFFWGGLLAIGALQFRPRAVVGMGSGEALIRRWRTWLRIVGITIPGAILTGVLLPFLYDSLRRFLQL